MRHPAAETPIIASLHEDRGDLANPLANPLACIGERTPCPVISGESRPRRYLDSAASTLMLASAHAAGERFLAHYASTHSTAHLSAETASLALARSREAILKLVNADPTEYVVVFMGAGSTAALNWLSRSLRALHPPGGVALLSGLEHHSNDLPHRLSGRMRHLPLVDPQTPHGAPDAGPLAAALEAAANAGEPVDFVAVTGASNVTGVLTPLDEVSRLCATAGVPLIVDGSQWVPHCPVDVQALNSHGRLDALVFSGHKTYAPGSPGVVVLHRALAEALPVVDVGGGMVESVYPHEFTAAPGVPERLEAGTPNLLGAITLGAAAQTLHAQGMATIQAREQMHIRRLWAGLATIEGVRLYGPSPLEVARTGCLPFNIRGIPHGLTARILSDQFAIEVRNGCFCAEPYVRTLLRDEMLALELDPDDPDVMLRTRRMLGLVRASLGVHVTDTDVDGLLEAVAAVASDPEHFQAQYVPLGDTGYEHRTFRRSVASLLPF